MMYSDTARRDRDFWRVYKFMSLCQRLGVGQKNWYGRVILDVLLEIEKDEDI